MARASYEYAYINSGGTFGSSGSSFTLPSARESTGSATANGFIYVTGGFSGATALADVQVSNNGANFSPTTALPTARGRHATVATSGFLYVLGGSDGASALSEVLVAPITPSGALGNFSATTPLPAPREGHTAAIWKGFLYVLGGKQGTAYANTVWSAPILANGNLGAFTATASFTGPREGHSTVAYDGFVYVLGGTNGGLRPFGDVQRAAVMGGGALGPFSVTTPLPRARTGHTTVARDGFLSVAGGFDGVILRDNQVAPILANGQLGNFWPTRPLLAARTRHASVVTGGNVYFIGGNNGASLNTVDPMPMLTPAARGQWSRQVTFAAPSTVVSITPNGNALTRGELALQYRTAPPSGVFAPALISRGVVALGAPAPVGSSNVQTLWVHFTLDDSQSALINPDDTGQRDLTDFSVVYNPDPTLTPLNPSTPPRGPILLACSGGSGAGYSYALTTNNSGATLVGPNYTAGPIGGVVDVVTCTDSLLAQATTSVTVTAGVSMSPLLPRVPPRGSASFSASNGSMTGFVWTLPTAPSGGMISAAGGAYVAGPVGNVLDTVLVTDSLGNTASTQVTVTAALALLPAVQSLAPRQPFTFTTFGGSDAGMTFSPGTNASGFTINPTSGLYTAGPLGSVTDTVDVSDSLGNTASATVNVTAGVSLAPSTATVPPRGTQAFVPSGGSATGFTFAITANGSGGTVDGGGAYRAGPTPSVTDLLQVTDSLGNTGTATITVSGGVIPSPVSPTVPPRGSRAFSATGGSGSGFGWSIQTNASGGSIDAAGNYQAGSTGSVTDVLLVTDSLGNTATVNVTVSAGISITPPSASRPPRGTLTFTASLGSGTGYLWDFLTAGTNGATISPTGSYVAGTIEGSDTVRVRDSLGNTATALVTVTNRLSVTPDVVTLPPRGTQQFSGTGGSDGGFTWALSINNSGASFDAGAAFYVAGSTGNVVDTVRLTDSLANVATAVVTVGPGVSVTPALPSTTPRGAVSFSATGGSVGGFTWSLQTNASGGTLSAAGNYVAGTTGGVTDVVTATDTLGNTGSASVAVGGAVSISPPALTVAPRESAPFSASGGSDAGFVWSFLTNASGGSLNAGTGAYRAGSVGSVTDVVQARDSLGNLAQADITVTPGVSIIPDAGVVPPRGTLQLQAVGGSESGFSWTLTTNRSGANLNSSSGVYTAGVTPDVIDELRVVDSLGNQANAVVNVTSQLAITPASPVVAPLQRVPFSALGGGGNNQWTITVNASRGSIDPSGLYRAGIASGVDTVQVTDALQNVATTQVTVTAALSLSPGMASVPPLGPQQFVAQGGSDGGFTFRVSSNLSGATIDATGAYQAGRVGSPARWA